MTNLPAFPEAQAVQALQYARTFVGRMMEPGFQPVLASKPLPMGPLHPDAGHFWFRDICKPFVISNDAAMLEFVRYAEAGNGDAIAILDEILDEILNHGGELPNFLATYVAKQRRGYIHPRGGKAKTDNILRDICIMVLLMDLYRDFGLHFTRSQSAKRHHRPSACSIAAQALAEAGIMSVDEPALHDIYRRWKGPLLTGWLGWRQAAAAPL